MNSNTALIGLIVVLITTAGGVLLITEISRDVRQSGLTAQTQQQVERAQGLEVVNVIGTNLTNEGVKYVRFQVRYDGEGALNLTDTFIQLRTTKSVTDLHYRNGTTTRDPATGFYTQ